MSGYNGRRGPNVSQYVAELNQIPAPQDYASEPLSFNDEDFAMFTNANFLELDTSTDLGLEQPLEFDAEAEQRNRRVHAAGAGAGAGAKSLPTEINKPPLDFLNTDFQFTDFSYSNAGLDSPMTGLPHSQAPYPVPSYTSPVSTNSVSPVTNQFDNTTGKKRKTEHIDPHSQQAIDEAARVAAEEDKRRRNTAASARFRVKKKQREQQLEKTAKEMTERVSVLETRISQLEMENNWLKSLITEKNEKTDVTAMYRKHIEENSGERSSGNHTDGVGTVGKNAKAKA